MSTRRFRDSVRHAGRGVWDALKTQRHMRLHLVAGLSAIVAAAWLPVDTAARALVWLAVALVWCAELLNTAMEVLVDVLSPEHRPQVGRIKDLAAGAVLVCCLIAAMVGVMIFWPAFLRQWR